MQSQPCIHICERLLDMTAVELKKMNIDHNQNHIKIRLSLPTTATSHFSSILTVSSRLDTDASLSPASPARMWRLSL